MKFCLEALAATGFLLSCCAQGQPSPYEPIAAPTLDGSGVLYNKVGRITFGSDGSVSTDKAAPVRDMSSSSSPVAAGTVFTRVGDTTFRSDGVAYNSQGNTTIGSDGLTYKRIGNSIFGSDGSAYIEMGDTIIGSDGSRYVRAGDRLIPAEEAASSR